MTNLPGRDSSVSGASQGSRDQFGTVSGPAPALNAIAATLRECFEISELGSTDELPPGLASDPRAPLQLGYLDAPLQRPFRLTLKDQAIADRAPAAVPGPYRLPPIHI